MRTILFLLFFIEVVALSGCVSSVRYHVQSFFGERESRVFPLFRFWAEFSREDIKGDVLDVPLIGFPGYIPVGYCADILVDMVCFPVDLVLSFFTTEPRILEECIEDGKYRLEMHFTGAQLHREAKFCRGVVPVSIRIERGCLSISSKTVEPLGLGKVHVSQEKWVCFPGKIEQYRDEKLIRTLIGSFNSEGGLRLLCIPNYSRFPNMSYLNMITGIIVNVGRFIQEPSLLCALDTVEIYSACEVILYHGGNIIDRMYNVPLGRTPWFIYFSPSPDCVGDVTCHGKSIREIGFIKD